MKRHTLLAILLLLTTSVVARTTLPINDGWKFFFKHENSSDNARIVTLPHTWDADALAARSSSCFQTAATYQNSIFIPTEWGNKRLFLKFYGVQNVADLFVNGRHAGEHRGGATAFTIEITDKVKYGSENSLRVDVSNTWLNDVLPTSTEINLYGGIYRNVELIVTDQTAISPLYLGSEGVLVHQKSATMEQVEGEVEIHATTLSPGSSCTVTLEITTPDGYQAFIRSQKARLDGKPILVPFSFEEPMLWSPVAPAIYTVTARIESENGGDEVSVRTGFREIRVTPEGGFMLNGNRINIKGVSLYHDNISAGSAYAATDYNTDLAFVRDLGANAIRSVLMPHAQYLYDQCDDQGVMAWVDLPLHKAPFLGDVAYIASKRFEENGIQQLREIIAQNINHPSVIMWGVFSCLQPRGGDDPLPYVRQLNTIAHNMDPSRPTVAASNQDGEINFVTDLIVWRQDVGWDKGSADDVKLWSDVLRKNWNTLRSGVCYGAEGILGQQVSEAPTTARTNWLPGSRQTQFHETYARHLNADSIFWGVWVDHLFDFGSARRTYGINASGLVTHDRRTAKDAYYLYRAMWNRCNPTLHIAEKRRTQRNSGVQQIHIYAQEQPTLLINGDTVAVHEFAPCQYRSDSVTLNGRCRAVVMAGKLTDKTEFTAGSLLKQRPLTAPLRKGGPLQTN